ncbi:uncharacterized protein ATNIH1004_007797 [Aspergillus tanneri]|uniref:Uncharacterized protein n=1 Tax=Aspergillus tanneri TaxID=1220188 RepID=A0A5M9MV55_9EURO|nr:uncharacterized protein ATNIH1004_007797 [Aspergillus tanneri]KAA8646367.1 hypothetical protein ATNIH1004_007797 [Aspergillus tanneri]
MLLTLKPSSQNGGVKGPHDYAVVRQSMPAAPRSSSSAVTEPLSSMESSQSGRRPPSLTLPPPDVGFAAMNAMKHHHSLPPPPQRQGSDASYASWLEARAEEDRRKQEEEKTRQESLRLEQRRIEQSMLRDSLHAGVPPHMIPLIFAGISQGGMPQSVLEVTQQYMAQPPPPPPPRAPAAPPPPGLPHSQRRVSHAHRDSCSIPPSVYRPPSVQPVGPAVLLSQPVQSTTSNSSTAQSLGRPSNSNGPADLRAVSRVSLSESQPQQQPPINLSNVHYAPGSSVPLTQPAAGKSEIQPRHSPPSLYFHHWVPPAQSQLNTPAGKTRQESPSMTAHHLVVRTTRAPQAAKGKHLGRIHQPPSSQNSRQGSPAAMERQPVSQLTHIRQRSDDSTELRGLEPSVNRRPSVNCPGPRAMASTEDTCSEKDLTRADDLDRSGYPSRSDSSVHFSHSTSQVQYASSVETAPHESDADSSPA